MNAKKCSLCEFTINGLEEEKNNSWWVEKKMFWKGQLIFLNLTTHFHLSFNPILFFIFLGVGWGNNLVNLDEKTLRVCLVTVFFLCFLFSKTIFCFLRQKTCLVTYFRQKSKIIFNFHFVKETENWSWAVFTFQFSLTLENTLKHAWKIAN